VVGLAGIALPPIAFAAANRLQAVTLVQATGAAAVAALVGLLAILLARRARREFDRTLGRVGGLRAARAGRWIGYLALWIGLTAGLALGFYELLRLFG
jgi:hypothetical protein